MIVKFDINHLENSVKTKVIIGEQKLHANFNRKVTIYNFDISSDLFGSLLKFHGKFVKPHNYGPSLCQESKSTESRQ